MNVNGKCKLDVAGVILMDASCIHGITDDFHLGVRHVDWKAAQLQYICTTNTSGLQMVCS